jgi:hypothetical protein
VAVEATGVYFGGFRFFRFWKHVDSRFCLVNPWIKCVCFAHWCAIATA